MIEFEASAEPLQDWLNNTEVRVQESSARLHDLPAKKEELSKLQVLHPVLVWICDSLFEIWVSLRTVKMTLLLAGHQAICYFIATSWELHSNPNQDALMPPVGSIFCQITLSHTESVDFSFPYSAAIIDILSFPHVTQVNPGITP